MRETQYRIVHPNIWDPSVEELIVGKVHQLHEKMSRSGSASAASSR
jgi:hypothetical protein